MVRSAGGSEEGEKWAELSCEIDDVLTYAIFHNGRDDSAQRVTMQRTFAHFNKIVRSDIYSHNRINLMTCFFYASLGNAVMTFLSTLFLSRGFAETFVLIYRRLLKPVR